MILCLTLAPPGFRTLLFFGVLGRLFDDLPLLLVALLVWTWLAMAAGFPAVLFSSGFLGLYSVVLLDWCAAGDEDSRRRDAFVRFGVMTERGPAAAVAAEEDTEIEGELVPVGEGDLHRGKAVRFCCLACAAEVEGDDPLVPAAAASCDSLRFPRSKGFGGFFSLAAIS